MEPLLKACNLVAGDGPVPNTGDVLIRSFTERGTELVQIRDKALKIAVVTLTVHHFGEARAMKLARCIKGMYLSGFSREQIKLFKESMAHSRKFNDK